MKTLKKLIAVLLVALLAFAVCACHQKNEIAVSLGKNEVTGAYYMCALVNADLEARQKVDEAKAAEKKDDAAATETVDYLKEKIDGTDYTKWVKDEAMKTVQEVLFFKSKCEELKLELPDVSYVEQYAEYYWSSYGYSSLYEPNGVSKETYIQFMKDSNYEETYFNSIYGEDGEKAPSKDELIAAAKEDYILVNKISGSLTDSEGNALDDTAKEELRTKLNGYVEALNAGSRTFEEIYHEYNNTDISSDNPETENAEETEEAEEEIKAINNHAEVMSKEDENFETVNGLELGKATLVETDSAILVYQKLNIEEDYYYVNNMASTLRHSLFDEEFDKAVQDEMKKCDFVVVDKAVDLFKVKKIKYPEAEA